MAGRINLFLIFLVCFLLSPVPVSGAEQKSEEKEITDFINEINQEMNREDIQKALEEDSEIRIEVSKKDPEKEWKESFREFLITTKEKWTKDLFVFLKENWLLLGIIAVVSLILGIRKGKERREEIRKLQEQWIEKKEKR